MNISLKGWLATAADLIIISIKYCTSEARPNGAVHHFFKLLIATRLGIDIEAQNVGRQYGVGWGVGFP